jgi:hypothetical protein
VATAPRWTQVELVGSEWVAPAEAPEGGDSEAPKQTKGVASGCARWRRRIRATRAAGRRAAHPSSQRRGGRQTSTPRKAGGS